MGRVRAEPVRELVAAPEPGPVFRLEYCDVRFWYPWHFHPELEIKHVVSGAGTRIIGGSVEPFEDGDLCVVGSGTPHCWSSPPRRGRWVRARVVQLLPNLFAGPTVHRGFAPFAALLDRARSGLQVTGPEHAEAVAELTRLFDARTEARQLAHLLTFFAIVADAPSTRSLGGPALAPRGAAEHHLTEPVLEFLQRAFLEPLAEEAVARRFGMSASAFSRFFTRQFGKSFSRYVVELRVARASNLLLREPLTVREIATRAGFGTVASLNRHFRAVKGMTPTAYRRRGRELNDGLRAGEGGLLRCDGEGRRPAPLPADD